MPPAVPLARPDHPCNMACLSHHEILELCAPFARAGRRVDLGGSDRMGGRVSFAPVVEGSGPDRWCEALVLECRTRASYRLRRTVTRADGMSATLETGGSEPAELLERIRAIDPRVHFDDRPGQPAISMALSGHVGAPEGARPVEFIATAASARLMRPAHPLRLDAAWRDAGAMSVRLVVTAPSPAGILPLPADLFAVLGWHWSMLRHQGEGWTGSVRLAGRGGPRAADAVRCIEQACRQVADTLAQPPAAFRRRCLAGRIEVLFRHSIPLLVWLLLIGQGVFAQRLLEAGESLSRAVLLAAPAVLLALFLWRSHEPRFGWPKWTRGEPDAAWPRWVAAEGGG